jgi:UDPglucose--hexose-1-phosphate uridylyltransferase
MELEFRKRTLVSEFESPFENFRPVQVTGEVRYCPLSGHPTRILPARLKEFGRIDWAPVIARSRELGCPFCPEALEQKTPRFPQSYGVETGRIRLGGATAFPNAFPYDAHCAVVVFTKEHYLAPGRFTPEMLEEAFAVSLRYFQKAAAAFPEGRQAILNWNYMPLAGAGIVHPHLQTGLLPEMTAFYRLVCERQGRYAAEGRGSLFAELVAREEREKERHLGATGKWSWLAAFAPRGIYEFWGILDSAHEIPEAPDADVKDLAGGICRILAFFEAKGVQAFNLSWYFVFQPPVAGMRHWVAIAPRVNFPGFGTSDVNYFDRFHGESITFVPPEDAARELRGYF